jgi:predicted lipoprotein with Yx(FWY)xxD motif
MSIWKYGRRGRPLLLPLLALAVATAMVFACSDDDDDDDAGGGSEPTAASAAPTQAPAATTAPAASPTAASAPAASLAIGVEEGELGAYLTGPDGRTLYVFTRDVPDTSNCSGGCLNTWPPLLSEGAAVEGAAAASGTFGAIDRPEGEQVTYNGAPLYYFAGDDAAGQTNGHLVGGVWFVARPDTASTSVVGVSPDASNLIGPTGLSLYLFANDSDGVSNCSGQCLTNWPALTVPEGQDPTAVASATGALGVITRGDDGTFQVTYNGLPLYYFAGDSLPGETNGDGVGGVWSLATP